MAAERRTLVIGGSGFLGIHVVRAALARGDAVVATTRELGSFPPNSAVERATWTRLDALTAGAVDQTLADVRPTSIVLCTALARIDECERYPVLARTLNVDLPGVVARWSHANAARLVHVSTDLVFGAQLPRASGFSEDDPPSPVSEYGRTKARGEVAVLDAHENALVVRLPLLFGNSFERGRGASDSLLDAIERGGRPTLFTDEWRTPLDVVIAARALVELAAQGPCGRLHIAGHERVSRHELGLRVLQARGVTAVEARTLVRASTRAESGHETRPADVSLDARRARKILDFELGGVPDRERR